MDTQEQRVVRIISLLDRKEIEPCVGMTRYKEKGAISPKYVWAMGVFFTFWSIV